MPVRRIVVLNPKGGSGKTTIATNLAAYFASKGLPTALLDHDAQGSSVRWLSKRDDEAAPIHGIAMFEEPVGVTKTFAHHIPHDIERVIVDTPASFKKHELLNYVRGADKVVVPVLPSDIDIHAAARTIGDLLLNAGNLRREQRLGVVANRVKRNTIVFRSLMKFLESLDIPVVGVLRDTQNYIRAAQSGAGLHEMSGPTLHKDLAQWNRLLRWLDTEPAPRVSAPLSQARDVREG